MTSPITTITTATIIPFKITGKMLYSESIDKFYLDRGKPKQSIGAVFLLGKTQCPVSLK